MEIRKRSLPGTCVGTHATPFAVLQARILLVVNIYRVNIVIVEGPRRIFFQG
jgi:hypothetical protein